MSIIALQLPVRSVIQFMPF